MLSFLKKKEVTEVELKSICNGKVIPIEKVPDKMFADRMLGDGVGFVFTEKELHSPCRGEVVMVAATKHAIGIRAENGAEILIHVGLDTVNLGGKGLNVLAKQGQKVRCGQLLMTIDMDFMKENNVCMVTPMILTNGNEYKMAIVRDDSDIYVQDTVMSVVKK